MSSMGKQRRHHRHFNSAKKRIDTSLFGCPLTGATGGKRVEVSLKAVTDRITVGGYMVSTENYNASYLSPIIEVHAGDIAAARVENLLQDRPPSPLIAAGRALRQVPSDASATGHAHHAADNATNLHFFHGRGRHAKECHVVPSN